MPILHARPLLTLADVDRIAMTAREEALRNEWKVSIAIVDDGGHPISLQRLDGCAPLAAYIAGEKARTAALGRRESKSYEDIINGGRTAFVSVGAITGMLEGGVPIMLDGHCVGAVGVSGVKPDQDAQVARIAASAVVALDGGPLI
jgi:glc operon protein GlcG